MARQRVFGRYLRMNSWWVSGRSHLDHNAVMHWKDSGIRLVEEESSKPLQTPTIGDATLGPKKITHTLMLTLLRTPLGHGNIELRRTKSAVIPRCMESDGVAG